MASEFIKGHRGKIWAESPASVNDYGEAKAGAGKGATFFVEVPISGKTIG